MSGTNDIIDELIRYLFEQCIVFRYTYIGIYGVEFPRQLNMNQLVAIQPQYHRANRALFAVLITYNALAHIISEETRERMDIAISACTHYILY
jgi:hypothetical protein